jgi:DNA polymerase-3 subunit gamma/tau
MSGHIFHRDFAGVVGLSESGSLDLAYVVLARKWRPAQFSDIVGQSHIVRTLMNAIRSERIHQAYLFTGSRGIGKTSIARIFAKAIRCQQSEWDGTWLKSCDQCASCREIASGNSVDVIEIDGASNNGVDAVREIRENAKYLPSAGSRKIYIIDEVHMLTTAAFNALLKTLEEPPPHVIFVFATTEPHKIPATILSRCQRFDYRRPTLAQIQARLVEVTQAEKIQAEPSALSLIARAAEGSLRDSMSLLDQVIAFSGNQVTLTAVRDSIGLIGGETITGVLRGILARKPLEALALVDEAYQQGHDLRVLAKNLIEFLHGAILAKVGAPAPATMELSDDEWKEISSLAQLRSLEEMELIFQALHYGVDWIARSPQPKVVLDVLLVKCATAEALVYADPAPTPAGPTSGGSGGRPAVAPSRAAPKVETKVETKPEQTPAAAGVSAASSAVSPAASIAASLAAQKNAPREVEKPAAVLSTSPTPVSTAARKGDGSWEGLIACVKASRPLLASILEQGVATQLPTSTDNALEINFRVQDAYYKEQLLSRVYAEQLGTIAKEFFGTPVRLKIELKEISESLAAKREREAVERESAARDAARNHPIISEARALFGGELGPIEVIPGEGAKNAAH